MFRTGVEGGGAWRHYEVTNVHPTGLIRCWPLRVGWGRQCDQAELSITRHPWGIIESVPVAHGPHEDSTARALVAAFHLCACSECRGEQECVPCAGQVHAFGCHGPGWPTTPNAHPHGKFNEEVRPSFYQQRTSPPAHGTAIADV